MSASRKTAISVVGSLNIDYICRVEFLPSPGATVPSEHLELYRGGKGANQAIAAARQECHICFFGAVGNDPEGQQYRKALESEKIDVSQLITTDLRTGAAFITVDELGENMIVTAAGANESVTAAHILRNADIIEACQAVLGQFETPIPALVEAIRIANRAEIPVVINPSPFNPTFPWQEIESDYVIVNGNEAVELLDFDPLSESSEQVRRRLHELRIGHLIITRGRDETLVYRHHEEPFEVPTLPVLPVDTVGAGDAFAGCFTARIACGESLDSAIRAANCAGALTTLGSGAQDPIPNRAGVSQHLETLA
ncbi:MAG: ribokinase [Verrucomicrobiota bacterium]